MHQPDTPHDVEVEPENNRDAVIFIVFSLITCVLMLITAVLLGMAL